MGSNLIVYILHEVGTRISANEEYGGRSVGCLKREEKGLNSLPKSKRVKGLKKHTVFTGQH